MQNDVQPATCARIDEQAWTPPTAESTYLPRRGRGERGQAAVEFALVVPFICLLVLALVDFGKAVNYWLDANHLANEGARMAAVLGNQPEPGGSLVSYIQGQAETSEFRNGSGSVTAPAQVCISFPNGRAIGKPVTVTVNAHYKWIPFIGAASFNISGSSTMRLEQLPTYADGCSS
jgi:Flp pilus assembly pilin Flp